MVTFDPTKQDSEAGGTLYKTSLLLKDCPHFWTLAGANANTALAKIVLGVDIDPENGQQFEVPELKERFCYAQLYPPVPSEASYQQDPGGPVPLVTGTHLLDIRRVAREAEIASHAEKNKTFLWFYDQVSALQKWMVREAEKNGCPRILRIEPIVEAAFNPQSEASAQGRYLFAKLRLLWGDEVAE